MAGTDAGVPELLEDVVVVFDPCMNPDGRGRIVTQVQQSAGQRATLDPQAMQRGRWPYGRGNHYLFDMNRDWMHGVCPETRARWRALNRFEPQLLVDAHEMGGDSTFLFSPPREPINRHVPADFLEWSQRFAADQARAFDTRGWSYYTREWFEFWGPYYSESWSTLRGALGILYEQASYDGQARLQRSGRVDTYGEAVHHQAASSLANLRTLAANRAELLSWFVAHRRAQVEPDEGEEARAVVLHDPRHPSRVRHLVGALIDQGIEVYRADEPTRWKNAVDRFGEREDELELPGGAWVVPARQPLGALVRTYFDRDPRMTDETLREERHELEKFGRSRMYDVTAWSFAHTLDLDARWVDAVGDAGLERVVEPPVPASGVVPGPRPGPAYGWIVDGDDDGSVRFAVRALAAGLRVHAAERGFRTAGRDFARGSLLVRRAENDGDVAERVARAARAAAVEAFATTTARAPDDGPDLGGGHFGLLVLPRVALVGGPPVAADRFGHLWHLFDRVLGLPVTQLEATSLANEDLRRYDVLVLPPTWSGPSGATRMLEPAAEALSRWTSAGGTLIAMGSSAAALANEELGLCGARLRRDALEDLADYAAAAEREQLADRIDIDPERIWDSAGAPEAEESAATPGAAPEGDGHDALERDEAWKRRFSPRGAFAAAHVDPESWLTSGCGPRLPVLVEGEAAFMTREPIRTPVRLAGAAELRLAGLLWPEARERLERTAWLAAERRGHGQVILFAAQPGFRGTHVATARLLANAVVLGPGLGADLPLPR